MNQNMSRHFRNEEECITKKPNFTLLFCKRKVPVLTAREQGSLKTDLVFVLNFKK